MIEKDTRLEWDLSKKIKVRGWSSLGFNEAGDINGDSHTIYGVTKNAADLMCQEWSKAFDIPIIINRFSCLYGPNQFGKVGQGWIVWFAIAKKLDLPLYYYGNKGKQVRDCLHIDDLCNLIEKQVNKISEYSGNYYNVGGGINHTSSVRELSDKLNKIMKVDHKVKSIDNSRPSDQKIYISDITKVSKDFNWEPKIGIDEGLINVTKWLEEANLDWVLD
jgi:CDP-paratose 2-epimerase